MNRLRHRAAQSGFVMLTALVIMLAITIIGAVTITSLLGEIQGEYGYNQAVSATGVAEAGLHWAINKMTSASATSQVYQGDPTQTLQDAGGQQFGVFDVAVMCADGITAVNAVSAGCNIMLSDGTTRPNQRMAKATGYVPTKAGPLGTRTLQALLSQNTFYNKTLCAYQSITLGQGVAVQGDVGSEGTTNPDLTLSGPSGSAATINPAPLNVQPGNAYAVTSVNCSQACGAPTNQVAGTVYGNQTPGSVCPKLTQVLSTYSCTTSGSANLSGGNVQIDSTTPPLNSITLASGGTVTFVTAGKTDVLTVNVNTITAGSDTQFIIQNGGIVQLNVASQLTVGQRSAFGLKAPTASPAPSVPLPCCPLPSSIPTSVLVDAGTFIVRSCNTGTPSPAIWFNQAGAISAVFMAPNGTVKMDQAQVPSRGAILASNIVLDQGTNFGFDLSASAVGLGFNKLVSWQDVP